MDKAILKRFLDAVWESMIAWEGEEDSVRDEHAEVIAELSASYELIMEQIGEDIYAD